MVPLTAALSLRRRLAKVVMLPLSPPSSYEPALSAPGGGGGRAQAHGGQSMRCPALAAALSSPANPCAASPAANQPSIRTAVLGGCSAHPAAHLPSGPSSPRTCGGVVDEEVDPLPHLKPARLVHLQGHTPDAIVCSSATDAMARKQGVQTSAAAAHEQGSDHLAERAEASAADTSAKGNACNPGTPAVVSPCVTGPAFCKLLQRMEVQHSRIFAAGSPAGWCPPAPLPPSLWPGGWRPCGCAAAPRCVAEELCVCGALSSQQ